MALCFALDHCKGTKTKTIFVKTAEGGPQRVFFFHVVDYRDFETGILLAQFRSDEGIDNEAHRGFEEPFGAWRAEIRVGERRLVDGCTLSTRFAFRFICMLALRTRWCRSRYGRPDHNERGTPCNSSTDFLMHAD